MPHTRLTRLGLEQRVVNLLSRHKILTCKDVLSRNKLELMKILAVNLEDVNEILNKVAHKVAPPPITAMDYKKSLDKLFLSTGLPELDDILGGGLPLGTISEIAGPSGSGKTQFCFMLAAHAVSSSHSVVYIDTERTFTASRLVEMAVTSKPDITDEGIADITNNIHVYVEDTCSSLLARLESLEEIIIEKGVKLVIVDSMASLVRKEYDSKMSLIDRSNLLAREAAILKYLAHSFSIPVFVTNQITTRFARADSIESDCREEGYVTAALGNTWSHCVNTRLILQYLTAHYRQILVAKSPIAPFAAFVYTIQKRGLVLEENASLHYDGTDPGLQHIKVRSDFPDFEESMH